MCQKYNVYDRQFDPELKTVFNFFGEKNEKNRFSCLIPQENRIEKCGLVVKSV